MKLYLTEILKESNELGFAQQPNVNFGTVMQPPQAPQMAQSMQQTQSVMVPQQNQPFNMQLPGGLNQVQLDTPKFTPTL